MVIDYALRSEQLEVLHSIERFNVLLAHRRFGKTVFAIILLIIRALECKEQRPVVHYYCPSYAQAKKVAWEYVKQYTDYFPGVEYNEAELKCTLPNGAVIQLGSADNPDSSRGIYSDFAVLDEPALMSPKMWSSVLRPALADRKGGCLFIGTPQGRHGLLYDTYQSAGEDDTWYRGVYKASETGILPAEELAAMRREMSAAEYEQELECSFDAAVLGAYWAEAMTSIDMAGQITNVSHDPGKLVHLAFDLGFNDATAVWFYQYDGDQVRFINHEEYTHMGFPAIVAELDRKGYKYGKSVIPHDGEHHSLSTGLKRSVTLNNLGLETVMAPKARNQGDIADHIDVARTFIKRCWFDRTECKFGVEALRQYRSIWDDKKGVGRLKPDHDWTSHSSESFRYLATTPEHMLLGDWGGELIYANDGRH